jgi:hypothetical protein
MKGPSIRRLHWWTAWAQRSFPVPLSPVRKTLALDGPTLRSRLNPAPADGAGHDVPHPLGGDGLHDEVACALPHRIDRVLDGAPGRHHDRLAGDAGVTHRAHEFDAVAVRQVNVDDEDVGIEPRGNVDRFAARQRRGDFEAGLLEIGLVGPGQRRHVLHHEDPSR